MKQQTAVEWLFKQLWDEPRDKFTWYAILSKAEEMEKEQIKRAFEFGVADAYNYNDDEGEGEEGEEKPDTKIIASGLIFPILTFFPSKSCASSSMIGPITWHGPHQVAQKSTSAGTFDFKTSSSKF